MSDTILDGKGRGYLAGVNVDNQLITRATSVEQRLLSAVDSNYFEITTGIVNLADANELDILYIKYTGSLLLVIDRVFYDTWASVAGVPNTGILRYYHTITSIAGGSDATATNTKFGAATSLDITATKSTVFTGGSVWWSALFTAGQSVAMEEGRIILAPSDTFGISVAADTSNTNMNVNLNVGVYELNQVLIQ